MSKRTAIHTELALHELVSLLNTGREYPDIAWRIARKHKVALSALANAYDLYCDDMESNSLIDLHD